jgi:hypothetical protein
MQVRNDVNAEVLKLIHRTAKPGAQITPKEFKQAYDLTRAQAIADTLMWKQVNITIKEH